MNAADRELLDRFSDVRRQTLELVRHVPEPWLGRRADGEDHALDRLFLHIAESFDWWATHVLRDGGVETPRESADRETLLRVLEASRRRLLDFFEADPARLDATYPYDDPLGIDSGAWTGRNRVLMAITHEAHHRGKIALALRQWGLRDLPMLV